MSSEAPTPRAVRFGVFEFDPAAGELRKQGMKIKLHGQPVEILKLLLDQPGEVVTREELQRKLWPATFRLQTCQRANVLLPPAHSELYPFVFFLLRARSN